MALRLTLVAHARTLAQKKARFAADESVEMDWQAQAHSRSQFSSRTTRYLCGPEARARETAALFSADVRIEQSLRDCDFGRWKGCLLDDIEPEQLGLWMADWQTNPHGGESVEQLCQRTREWMAALTGTGHIVAVTHPLVMRAALMNVLQCPPSAFHSIDIEPLSMIDLRCNGKWRMRVAPSPQPSPGGRGD